MKRTLGTVGSARKAQRTAEKAPAKRYDSQEKANRWMVTLNFAGASCAEDFTPEHQISFNRLNAAAQVPPCTYAVFQPEMGEHGTFHVQGYFEFNKRMTMKQVKDHVGSRCHLDAARGTQDECIAYCTKETDLDADPPVYGRIEDGEVMEFGERMKVSEKTGRTAGSRTDWADVWAMVKQGAKNTDILDKHPAMIPNVRAIQHARFAVQCESSRNWTTKLLVLWGTPDSGKTTTAISLCEKGRYFIVAADGKQLWWDGYDPSIHDTVIFDEFVGSRAPITFMNQICDSIDLNVQTKGGFSRFLAKRVIITSNFSPREWYRNVVEARQESLWRRIATEVEFRLVDEVIDMHGDPADVERRLQLVLHKGTFDPILVKSKYPFFSETQALFERARVNDDDSGSEDVVDQRKAQLVGRKQIFVRTLTGRSRAGSSESPIVLGSESEADDHVPRAGGGDTSSESH